MEAWATVWRLGLAFVLGGLVGWEREQGGKPAGLRTLILVSTGSALFVLVAERAALASAGGTDMVRIIAGIAQGIGFLGAGTIVVAHGEVHGLTTAAAVWAISAVGIACGLGAWQTALVGTVIVFVALRALTWLEARVARK